MKSAQATQNAPTYPARILPLYDLTRRLDAEYSALLNYIYLIVNSPYQPLYQRTATNNYNVVEQVGPNF